jgi:hypothetical protein
MNKKILTLIVSLVLLGSSCSDFLSVNEKNPNTTSAVPPKLLLPAALTNVVKLMDNPSNFDFVYLWHGLWSISQGYAQPAQLMQYKLFNTDYQGIFGTLYTVSQNFLEMEKAATDPKDGAYKAIAIIMRANVMQILVDVYGNVPYSEAWKSAEGILKPKYDDQKAIYEDAVLKLDAAIKIIQALPAGATALDGSSDVMFQGDMSKWAKYANTLKLRMLVHQAGMTGRDTYIKSAIATTSSVGYLGAGEGALVNPGFLKSDTKMSPFYERFFKADDSGQSDGTAYYFAGKDGVDFLKTASDPRIERFYLPYSGTSYSGNYLGQDPTTHPAAVPGSTSRLGYMKDNPGYLIGTYNKSAPLLTDFESLFIQAEAVERGYITGNAKSLYGSAIKQSFVWLGLSPSAADAYLVSANDLVNYDTAPNKINLILNQKWISLMGVAPLEIWTDYRRTGIPSNLHFSEDPNKANSTPPVRMLYPQTEISYNNASVVAVGPIDAFKSKIFWQNR